MDRAPVEEILASLENLNILELRDLLDALSAKYQSFTVVDEAAVREEKARREAYWTPWYRLVIVRIDCDQAESGKKLRICKTLRELIPGLGLKEAKNMVDTGEGLPLGLPGITDEHPSKARKKFLPLREQLEALGVVVDEEYNYGYFD